MPTRFVDWYIGESRARGLADYALEALEAAGQRILAPIDNPDVWAKAVDELTKQKETLESTILTWTDESFGPKMETGAPLSAMGVGAKAAYQRYLDSWVAQIAANVSSEVQKWLSEASPKDQSGWAKRGQGFTEGPLPVIAVRTIGPPSVPKPVSPAPSEPAKATPTVPAMQAPAARTRAQIEAAVTNAATAAVMKLADEFGNRYSGIVSYGDITYPSEWDANRAMVVNALKLHFDQFVSDLLRNPLLDIQRHVLDWVRLRLSSYRMAQQGGGGGGSSRFSPNLAGETVGMGMLPVMGAMADPGPSGTDSRRRVGLPDVHAAIAHTIDRLAEEYGDRTRTYTETKTMDPLPWSLASVALMYTLVYRAEKFIDECNEMDEDPDDHIYAWSKKWLSQKGYPEPPKVRGAEMRDVRLSSAAIRRVFGPSGQGDLNEEQRFLLQRWPDAMHEEIFSEDTYSSMLESAKIPPTWTSIVAKAGSDDVPSILDAIWYPGYEGLYRAFLDWVSSSIDGYLAGARELKWIGYLLGPSVSPISPIGNSVWNSAKAVKGQARKAFQAVISVAITAGSSEADLLAKLQSTWNLIEGSRHAEIVERLKVLSNTAQGWYKSFARPYFMIQAPTTTALFAIWHKLIAPRVSQLVTQGLDILHGRFPTATNWLGKYIVSPLGAFRRSLYGLRYIPGLIRGFISKAKELVAVGGPSALTALLAIPAGAAAIIGALLAVLLINYRVDAPTLSDREMDELYSDPKYLPYRQEAANLAMRVHNIENSIASLSAKTPEPGFSERVLSEPTGTSLAMKPFTEEAQAIAEDIRNLHATAGDKALDPVRQALLSKLASAGVGKVAGGAIVHLVGAEIPDAVIEAYYDPGRITEILSPAINRLLDGRDPSQIGEDEWTFLMAKAQEESSAALEAYAEEISRRVLEEQSGWVEDTAQSSSVDAAAEAMRRLGSLIQTQSIEREEYERVSDQLRSAATDLTGEDRQIADDALSAMGDLLGVLE